MSLQTKLIEILDPQAGKLRETVVNESSAPQTAPLFEVQAGRKQFNLMEASTTGEFPTLLRDGLKAIVYESYAGTGTTWQQWAGFTPSDKQSEDWIESNALGELPVVHENAAYPEAKRDLDRTVNIRNDKRGMILSVTEELIRFNKVPQIRFDAAEAGRVAANTREQSCFSVLTTAGNYVRTTAAGDNDVGNNTAATTFSAAGLVTALGVLRTMKDRKSGVFFGVNPDTLIVTPRLEFAAKQLLMSPAIQIPGDGVTTAKVYGTGTVNPFRGLVNQIIVSPRLGTTFQWVLMEARRAVLLQEVDGLQVLQESANQVQFEGYFRYDTIRYRIRDWFGVGMLNDRFAYYSSATAAPAVG